jgi:hypothetical protein
LISERGRVTGFFRFAAGIRDDASNISKCPYLDFKAGFDRLTDPLGAIVLPNVNGTFSSDNLTAMIHLF